MANSIGNHTFCFLRRNDERGAAPELLDEQKSILRRPGTDGTSVRHEGKAGVPFRVRTLRDFESVTDALNTIGGYKTTEADDMVYPLIWNDVNYESGYGLKYAVLRVGDFSIRRVTAVAGPVKLTTTPTHILEATWDLLPVEA